MSAAGDDGALVVGVAFGVLGLALAGGAGYLLGRRAPKARYPWLDGQPFDAVDVARSLNGDQREELRRTLTRAASSWVGEYTLPTSPPPSRPRRLLTELDGRVVPLRPPPPRR